MQSSRNEKFITWKLQWEAHMKIVQYILITLLAIGIISCSSLQEEAENTDLLSYQALALNFSIEYPKSWHIFESEDALLLSNSIDPLIEQSSDRLNEKGDFFISLSVAPNEAFAEFITLLVNKKLSDNINETSFSSLLQAQHFNEDFYTQVTTQYQSLFNDELSEQHTLSYQDDLVIMGSPLTEDVANKQYMICKIIENEIVALIAVMYNNNKLSTEILEAIISIMNSIEVVT